MQQANQHSKANAAHKSAGAMHYIVFFALVAVFTVLFQTTVIPSLVKNFVTSQFAPETGLYGNFQGVEASMPGEAAGRVTGAAAQNKDVTKEAINGEYIFDFTSKDRNATQHGYDKAAGEWLVKAPKLGEEAIILEPYGFYILSFDFGFILAVILTTILPPTIGYISHKFAREVHHTGSKIRLQTGFSDETVDLLSMPDKDFAKVAENDRDRVVAHFRRVWDRTVPEKEETLGRRSLEFDELYDEETDLVDFRNDAIYLRIKEFFSDTVLTEIEDTKAGREWEKNRISIFKGMRLYMAHHFTHSYSNNVTGFAYGGAAILIIAVGIRGLKFIPSTRPSLILFAILLEFSMLALLAFVLFYTQEEERMDKMLKKMEDASRNQLETLKGQSDDMHRLAETLEGGTAEHMRRKVEAAISDYFSSNDHINKVIAEEISQKIVIGLRGEPTPTGSRGQRR